ncbi:xanthine dehydrogenase family protein molybdopterin-binding subunit [Afifella marina]|uniref:Xanthine dehydrogenase YagR molybdenum-binding subunit n=1 Tax=Afifella marina DSM 2698 TaxID=1120955 RepID=A0A1G5NGH8_AFIMA|nr:xanthine dehydrogenase family protein molybdopterin-binding subunit [Afifella marina]MBK1623437.1 xanthine dehydrogenase [Afifella marina DSM 2698]MBK1626431.1 xanthine dehydrogenase [Afifella marina]MBK5917309.1 xanthine dehydrogenase [Afifella marina]RAI18041.1 xanthine dehydrogenase [Afifella marina DSM 2698]SCZ35839.1 xanthine dehydrogenase YagR molybdenum-binding subunit [Afifella marina DSM 2698]
MTTDANTYAMDEAVGETRLDRGTQGVLGKPLNRYEGALKVSGRAPYAYEHLAGEDVAYGFMVTAGIGRAKIRSVDTSKAEAAPGVLTVISGDDVLRASALPMAPAAQTIDGEVFHYGQPLALVVAETFEAARHAATLVETLYEPGQGRYSLRDQLDEAVNPGPGAMQPDNLRGEFEAVFAEAEVQFDETYTTPSHSAAAMEPHASVAKWDGDNLTVWSSCQLLETNVIQIANGVGVPVENVRLLSPYVGGGFGSKLGIGPDAVLAALGAKAAGKPVKVALSRQHVFQTTSRRSETIQRVRIGTTKEGRITALAHENFVVNSTGNSFFEPVAISTVFLYAGENRKITHRLAETDVLMTASVRAPGEAVGMLSLESAMDELAIRLDLDPIEFRKLNEPEVAPQDDLPFSSRKLLQCYEEGASRFGWQNRPEKPASRREGEWWIGSGMAAASRSHQLMKSSAEVELAPDGRATVRTAMTDIGTGSYTILQQITAEMLGLPPGHVTVLLGDTALPPSSGSGGSWGANSAGSSVYLACEDLVRELAKRLDVDPSDLTLKDGQAIAGNRQIPLGEILGGETLTGRGTIEPGKTAETTNQASYGAHFCEVAVNAVTGETRVRRLLTVAAAGRILNEKTATSQCYGGQIWGIGSALEEELVIDPRTGLLVNHDLAEYHVPVNADVPQLEVVFLEERDTAASLLAGKGLGELALAGVGAAITNAIYNACGVRVRDYPATLDKVLAGLPDA